jgi:hypothetical protein
MPSTVITVRLILIYLDAHLEQLAELGATRLANDAVVDRAGQQHDDPHAAAGSADERPGHPGVGKEVRIGDIDSRAEVMARRNIVYIEKLPPAGELRSIWAATEASRRPLAFLLDQGPLGRPAAWRRRA